MDERLKTRLAFAEQLLQLAEHSSEAEMRTSLSRIYYAAYHVAIGMVGNRATAKFLGLWNSGPQV